MADQNIVTNITATANFSGLTAQLQAVTSQLLKLQATTIGLNKNLTSQVGVMNRQFDETMRSTGQFARHFVTLTSDVSKFGQNLDSGRMKLGDYFRTWQGHTRKTSSLVRDLAKQQVMLENAIIQPLGKNAQGLMQYNVMVQSGLDVTKNKSALLRQELSIMNKVMNDGAGQLINWGKNTQWAGRQLTVGLTVPIAAFGMAAAKAFREADQELVRLTKVYGGLTATSTADLLQVRKDVTALSRELASGLGANFKETIGLAADIAATGKEGNALLEATRQTTRLAVLGEVDRQEAMKATLSIQSAFGQSTEELAQSIDFLNAVENQTSTSLQDLVEAIPKAGPVVKALGGDVQDLALYLTAMREGGINASEGANALKSALASIINPTKVATEMFQGFGIDLGGIVTKNAGNLTATVMALKDSLDSLDPLSRARAIEQLFGKFQFARMNALFENLGKQGSQTLQVLDLMKASTTDLANISARELKTMTESASGKYKRALESVKADLVVIGEQFLKVGTFVLNAIDGIIKFIGQLPAPIKAVLGFIGGLTAVAGPIIMLTGVLANFFGYIVKGIFALKNIGKGGTGFKLLTPELMAAEAAAKSVEESFYSDAKAAATFSDAVLTLASSFEKLKASAMSSTIATANSMSTLAGNTVLPGGGRIVDKNNPLIGQPYSRDMSHVIPTGSKTAEQRANETIFSTFPGPKPVNQRISNSPQVYMTQDMPKIPGITSVNGVSTGIVAGEAAKWHSMTAAIAMQSQAEITMLKQEVAATGTITSSLSDSYQALLPQMTKITSLAADETALIVKDLQAGKITVEAARSKIFTLNAQVEAMMAETARGIATAQARTLNLTTVPLTTQPVVSAAGKSNMKELFHKTETSKLVDQIAKNLGVRTSGAGYSMHTTIPRKYNKGGAVEGFGPNKTQVSGPASISYDDRLGTVPLGGYVLNQKASMNPDNAALVAAAPSTYGANMGGQITAMLTPKETVFGPGIQDDPELFRAVDAANKGFSLGGRIKASKLNYGLSNPRVIAMAANIRRMFPANLTPKHLKPSYEVKGTQGAFGGGITNKTIVEDNRVGMDVPGQTITRSRINRHLEKQGVPPDVLLASIYSGSGNKRLSTDVLLEGLVRSRVITATEAGTLSNEVFESYAKKLATLDRVTDMNNPVLESSRQAFSLTSAINSKKKSKVIEALNRFAASPGAVADVSSRGSSGYLQYITLSDGTRVDLSPLKGAKGAAETFYHAPMPQELKSIVDSFAMGGLIGQNKKYYGINSLPKNVIERLTAKWPAKKPAYKQGLQYVLGNDDPLHGPLQIGRSQNLKSSAGYDPNANPAERILYRDDFNRMAIAGAFLVGDQRRRGLYSTARYMSGDLDIMSQMETLKNHPLGPIAAMKSLQTKFSGKLYRGILGNSTQNPLPKNILDEVLLAKQTGDWSSLLGKEFIMRRSSWSKDQEVASFFAMRNQKPDSILLEARVRNRNILDASSLFPKKAYQAPYGQSYNTGRFGTGAKNEQEAIFGGKFKIIGYNNGKLQLETVAEAREMGGPVDSGKPYLVGEKGPELFIPKNSGGIIPNYEVGGLISRGKSSYGLSGNPAKRAQQLAEQAARAAAYQSSGMTSPEYKEGPLSGSKTTIVGAGGARTNVYGLQGSYPYAPGLKLPLQGFNIAISNAIQSIATGLKIGSDKLITSTRMMGQEIKTSLQTMSNGAKSYATSIVSTGKKIGESYRSGGAAILQYGVPGATASGVGTSYAYPGLVPTGQKMKTAFSTNLKYSTAAIAHPLQYLKSKNIGENFGQGMGSNMVGTMGGMAAGTALGAKLGGQNGAMIGSMIGMVAGPSVTKALGAAVSGMAAKSVGMGVASAGLGATAAGIAGLVAPIAAVTAATYAGYKAWKYYKEGQDLNISTFGMTAEAAKKAGLKYTDFGARIKETIQDARDLADANKLVYQSMKDGGTPFQMTIAEYKKLKVEVKETFSEQIKALDRQPSNKVPDAVRRLKEQLIAAGMSAEEATKKVYTMLRLSNKRGQAVTATIGNADFNKIKDAQTAAVGAVTDFGQSTRTEGNKERAAALNTALMATETAINDLIAKRERLVAKDTTGKIKSLTYTEAEKIMIDKLNTSKEATTKITKETVNELAKANPQIKKMINGSDTIVSVWQKIRLQAQGFKGDLSKLDAETAGIVASVFSAVSDSVQSTNRAGMLKSQYDNLETLKGQIASYTKALKGQTVAQQISDRDRISALNKQIDANNKLADARKKALEIAQQDADLGRQIEKTRLEMQNALAVGDTGQAQSLRIELESLTSQQQTESQMRAIDKANEAANAPLKAAVESIGKKQQKLGDSAALAGESLDKVKDKYDKQQAAIDKVNNAMTALYANAAVAGISIKEYVKQNKEAAAGLVAAVEAATGKKMERYSTDAQGKKVPISPQANALTILSNSKAGSSVDLALANSIKGGKTLADIVNAIKGTEQLRKDIAVSGNYSNSMEEKTFDGKKVKVLNSEAREAIGDRLDLKLRETFVWNGQRYGKSAKNSNIVYIGPVEGKAEGGIVRGPGTGTSDSISAMVMPAAPGFAKGGMPIRISDGEFIFSKKAIDNLGGEDVVDRLHKSARNKDGWLQKWAKSLTGQRGAEMFGTAALVRKLAGMGQKGDNLSAGLIPLNFLGMGGGSTNFMKVAGQAAGAASGQIAGKGASFLAAQAQIAGITSAKMARIDKEALAKIGKNANQGWQEIQNARMAQLAKKYKDLDKLSVQKFNEIYAKEFYGLSAGESISIFKGDIIDAATAKATWDASKASYFSRIPDVAAAYSDMLRVAKPSQDKGGSILASKIKISSLTNKLGEGIDLTSAQGMGEFPIKMTAENFKEIMENLVSYTPDEFAQLQGFAATGKKMGKYALDPLLGYAKAFGFANGGLLQIPQFKKGINAVPKDMLAMLHKNEAVLPANMNPYNPDGPRYNFNRNSYRVSGDGAIGTSYVVNQNIYASEGMDVEALSNMIVKKAEVVIGQKAKVNVKMVGQGKSI